MSDLPNPNTDPAGFLGGVAALMRERAGAATPGPWRVGDNQHVAGVGFGNGPDRCSHCSGGHELTWHGTRDINGRRILAHVHTGETWWEHGIYAERPDGHVNVVNDTDEYGYMKPADAEHIASWHPAAALAVAGWLAGIADAIGNPDAHDMGAATPREERHALAVARAFIGSTP